MNLLDLKKLKRLQIFYTYYKIDTTTDFNATALSSLSTSTTQ